MSFFSNLFPCCSDSAVPSPKHTPIHSRGYRSFESFRPPVRVAHPSQANERVATVFNQALAPVLPRKASTGIMIPRAVSSTNTQGSRRTSDSLSTNSSERRTSTMAHQNSVSSSYYRESGNEDWDRRSPPRLMEEPSHPHWLDNDSLNRESEYGSPISQAPFEHRNSTGSDVQTQPARSRRESQVELSISEGSPQGMGVIGSAASRVRSLLNSPISQAPFEHRNSTGSAVQAQPARSRREFQVELSVSGGSPQGMGVIGSAPSRVRSLPNHSEMQANHSRYFQGGQDSPVLSVHSESMPMKRESPRRSDSGRVSFHSGAGTPVAQQGASFPLDPNVQLFGDIDANAHPPATLKASEEQFEFEMGSPDSDSASTDDKKIDFQLLFMRSVRRPGAGAPMPRSRQPFEAVPHFGARGKFRDPSIRADFEESESEDEGPGRSLLDEIERRKNGDVSYEIFNGLIQPVEIK